MILLYLAACGSADPETLVDELRVMAIQPNPAELTASFEGAEASFDVLVADPEEEGAELLFWTCTNLGDGCLESEFYPDQPEEWVKSSEVVSDTTTFSLLFPSGWAGVISEIPEEAQPFRASIAWALACRPGVCPLIGEAGEGKVDTEALSSPFDLAASLPSEGVSLAFRSLLVSTRAEEERVRHPELEPLFTDLEMEPGGTMELPFSYVLNGIPNEDSRIYGYATKGGFMSNDPINSLLGTETGETTLSWSTDEGEEEGPTKIYVILENGEGGIEIWTGEGSVGSAP